MKDLTWVERTKVVREDDHDAKEALHNNPGWHLLYITGGLHAPIEYVFGWGELPQHENEEADHA